MLLRDIIPYIDHICGGENTANRLVIIEEQTGQHDLQPQHLQKIREKNSPRIDAGIEAILGQMVNELMVFYSIPRDQAEQLVLEWLNERTSNLLEVIRPVAQNLR